MRYPSFLLPPFALIAGALLCALPSGAQEAVPPGGSSPAPAITPLAPSLPTTPAPSDVPLAIAAPPGAKLRVEMDARSEDILGMLKSFLKGIGETGQTAAGAGKTPGQPPPPSNPIAEALDAGNLADILKDVNHVHFVVYELPGPPPPLPSLLPVKPQPKGAKAAPTPPRSPAPDPIPAFDSNAFYESAFSGESAHRILYTDADAYKLVMVGFPDRHGFAFAVSGAGYVAVSRSDGYPNMEVLSAFISHVTSSVMKSKTAQKILDSTMNSEDAPSKPAPSPDKSSE